MKDILYNHRDKKNINEMLLVYKIQGVTFLYALSILFHHSSSFTNNLV